MCCCKDSFFPTSTSMPCRMQRGQYWSGKEPLKPQEKTSHDTIPIKLIIPVSLAKAEEMAKVPKIDFEQSALHCDTGGGGEISSGGWLSVWPVVIFCNYTEESWHCVYVYIYLSSKYTAWYLKSRRNQPSKDKHFYLLNPQNWHGIKFISLLTCAGTHSDVSNWSKLLLMPVPIPANSTQLVETNTHWTVVYNASVRLQSEHILNKETLYTICKENIK